MPEFLIILMIWLGLLDPTSTYTVAQVQQIATTNATTIQQSTPGVDTTTASWQQAAADQKEIKIIDPNLY